MSSACGLNLAIGDVESLIEKANDDAPELAPRHRKGETTGRATVRATTFQRDGSDLHRGHRTRSPLPRQGETE